MIIVFGSISMDVYMDTRTLPQPGDEVRGHGYEMAVGGKGSNQALAASRFDIKTALVGRIGDDGVGLRILHRLRREGVMTTGVGQSPHQTGCACIIRGPNNTKQVILAMSANTDITADQVPDEILKPGNIVVMQMDVPPEQNWELIKRAKEKGATTILNLSPVSEIPQNTLEDLDYLVANKNEAEQALNMTDIDAETLAHAFALKGNITCIITMGKNGSVAATPDGDIFIVPALELPNFVDRTAAGDAYCGTLAAALHEKKSLPDALKYASISASLTCTKKGALSTIPRLGNIEDELENLEAVQHKKAPT